VIDDVTDFRLKALEDSMGRIGAAVDGINGSLVALTRLEERHMETRQGLERAFAAIKEAREDGAAAVKEARETSAKDRDATNERLRLVELEMPTLRLVRGWVIAAAFAIICACGALVWDATIHADRRNSPAAPVAPAQTIR